MNKLSLFVYFWCIGIFYKNMFKIKAKHFRKLRKKLKVYYIQRSFEMFGDFANIPIERQSRVVGLSYSNAVYRYARRTHTISDILSIYETPIETNEMFGKWKIVPADTPYTRFIKYFR